MSGKNPLGNGREPQSYEGLNIVVPVGGWQLIKSTRAPTSNDRKYPIGSIWINTTTSVSYQLVTVPGVWTILGSAAGGDIQTLTGGSGGALLPTAGNMNILGTANQLTSTGSGSTITFSLPAAITAPGSLTTTTSLAATTTVTAGTGVTATTGNIVASAGNISATLGSVAAGTSVTAGTTLTATLGNITATNGNLVLSTAGNKLSIATGANASVGTSDAMVAGTVTISTTAVTASSKIFLTANTPGGTQGTLSAPTASIVAGTSFVINSSSNTDTSTVNWWIVN